MRKLFFLFVGTMAICVSCTQGSGKVEEASNPSASSPVVTIGFSTPVNGYEVKAFWKPLDIVTEHIVGPALLRFIHSADSSFFYVTTDQFSVPMSQLPFQYSEESGGITGIALAEYVLPYDTTALEQGEVFGTTAVPFFFKDLNFDKQKELLIGEAGKGQRHYPAFKVYELDGYGGAADLSRLVPYNEIDGLTQLDSELQQIIIHKSGGDCGDEVWTYFRSYGEEEEKGEIKLGKVVSYEKDEKTGDCKEIVELMTN